MRSSQLRSSQPIEVFAVEVAPRGLRSLLIEYSRMPIHRVTTLPSISKLLGAEVLVVEADPSVQSGDLDISEDVISVEGSAEHVFFVMRLRKAFPEAHENTEPGIEGLMPTELTEVVRPIPVQNIHSDLPLGAPSLNLGKTTSLNAFLADGSFESIMRVVQAYDAFDRTADLGDAPIIAIIDSGIDRNVVEEPRRLGGFTDIPGGDPWVDDYGHGTMIALTSACCNMLGGVQGVNPQALIYSIKLRPNEKNAIPTASILRALDAVVSLSEQVGQRIILNNSWGLYGCKNLLMPCNILITRVLKAADRVNAFLSSWAIGNNRELCGSGQVTGYCMNTTPWSVTTGALDAELNPQPYSSIGGQCFTLHPTVTVPTFGILPWGTGFRDTGTRGLGTSFCAAVTSGVLSLMHRAMPGAPNIALRAALRNSALLLNDARAFEFYDPETGSGLLQAADAIEAVPGAAQSEVAQYERDFPTRVRHGATT